MNCFNLISWLVTAMQCHEITLLLHARAATAAYVQLTLTIIKLLRHKLC